MAIAQADNDWLAASYRGGWPARDGGVPDLDGLLDRLWCARLEERWLGQYQAVEDERDELDRVAFFGRSGGIWFVATCLVDGEGRPQDLQRHVRFGHRDAAATAWRAVR